MRNGVWLILFVAIMVLSGCFPFQRQAIQTLDDLEDDSVTIDMDSEVQSDRHQAMNSYQELIAAAPGTLLEIEAQRRVADLQIEINNVMKSENKALARQQQEGREAIELVAAIQRYNNLLDTYPNQPGNDQVLYQLARAYDETGDPDAAMSTLGRLVNGFPDSPYVAEASFRRAEMYFLLGEYSLAEPEYRMVLSFGKQTPFYHQSQYKLGWSVFKQEDYRQALNIFFDILGRKLATNFTDSSVASIDQSEEEIINETLRVISLSFSYIGGVESIDDFFAKHSGQTYENRVYGALAELYLEKERYFDAAQTFEHFSQRHPMHALAPAFMIKSIETYRRGNFPSQVLASMTTFAEQYDLDRPYWGRHTPSSQPKTVNQLRSILKDLATHQHAIAQKSHISRDYDLAIDLYRRYLRDFPRDTQSMEFRFLIGEAFYEDKRYAEAAVAYEVAAYDYPPHSWDRRSAQAAVSAFDRQETLSEGKAKDIWHRRALASRLRLADRFPRHPDAGVSLAKAAQDYFTLEEYDAAAVSAQRLLNLTPEPSPTLRTTAWLVLGHIAFDQGGFSNAEHAYREALNIRILNAEKRKDTRSRLASSIYKQGEQLRTNGDLAGAATEFLRVASADPGSAIHAIAEYDAAAAMIALKQWSRVIKILEAFKEKFPRHELEQDISIKLAAAYLENGQKLDAAEAFERLGDLQKEPALRQESLWTAAQLYAQSGKLSDSAKAYKRYITEFPNDIALGIEGRHQLAELNQKAGNVNRYHHWLRQLIKFEAGAGKDRNGRSKSLGAHASLVLAQSIEDGFAKIKLKLPLEKTLKLKKQLMEKALAAFRKAEDYGIAEVSTASAYGIAETYHAFSRALMSSQRPKGLSADELEEYDILLEEQAYPFEEDAISIHEGNSRLSADGIYDNWVKASFKVLATMLPVRYAKPERSEAVFDVME